MGEEIHEDSRRARKIGFMDAPSFEREGFSGHTLVPSEAGLGFSALLIDAHGRHPRKRMVDTTRTYFVIEGNGSFTLGDEVSRVQKGDLFVIPPGCEYEYEGHMELFEVNISPDNSFKDEKLE